MTANIFCYGEIGIDNIVQVPHLPTPELAAFPSSDSYHIGGAAANTAVWLAQLGIPTRIAGNVLGHDPYGSLLWRQLANRDHLDLSLIERDDAAATPFCRVLVTPDGERSFLIYGYPQARKLELDAAHLSDTRYLALDLYGGEERRRAAAVAHAAGIKTAISDIIDADHPVLPQAPIVTNSAAFMRDALPGVDVVAQIRKLQAISGGIVVATDGGRELCCLDEDGHLLRARPPSVTAVDATGAGDAFRAGFLAGLVQGERLPRALCLGLAAGALSVRHLGAATTVPAAAEIRALAATLTVYT